MKINDIRKISVQDWLSIACIEEFPEKCPQAGKFIGSVTQRQKEYLNRNRICHSGLSCYQANIIIKSIISREKAGMAKPEQLLTLLKNGHYPGKLRRTTEKTAVALISKW